MDRAARGDADGRAALAAGCKTDRDTLARVAAALHGQLGGTLQLLIREDANAAGAPMERRVVTWPRPMPPGGAQ